MGQMDTRRWSVIPKIAAGFGVIGVVRLHRSTGWTLRALVACGLVEPNILENTLALSNAW
jgi:hypothetical protein